MVCQGRGNEVTEGISDNSGMHISESRMTNTTARAGLALPRDGAASGAPTHHTRNLQSSFRGAASGAPTDAQFEEAQQAAPLQMPNSKRRGKRGPYTFRESFLLGRRQR
jgi:hypothetical protein